MKLSDFNNQQTTYRYKLSHKKYALLFIINLVDSKLIISQFCDGVHTYLDLGKFEFNDICYECIDRLHKYVESQEITN